MLIGHSVLHKLLGHTPIHPQRALQYLLHLEFSDLTGVFDETTAQTPIQAPTAQLLFARNRIFSCKAGGFEEMSCGTTLSPCSSQHSPPQKTYICEATLASGAVFRSVYRFTIEV
ncbi:hypothetical protein EK904_008938 [Melospiza melodia maxima]|nr:hypothetical protein EK904_008938 [Melospiza melodia maxima]